MSTTEGVTQQALVPVQRGHHPLGMSRLNYWEDCPGFESQEEASQRAVIAAEEGETNHDRMDLLIERIFSTQGIKPTSQSLLQSLAALRQSGEEAIDDHDYGLLNYCCRELGPFLDRGPEKALREEKVEVYNRSNRPVNFGYYDLLLLYRGGALGIVVDYKFGAIPVPPAWDNAQGCGYALAVLQANPGMEKCMAVFIQPKTGVTTRHVYTRKDMEEMLDRVLGAIAAHTLATRKWGTPEGIEMLNVSPYCKFCEHAEDCPRLRSQALAITSKVSNLPMPASFRPEDIKTPEEASLATYLCQVLEDAVGPIRRRALEVAKASGDKISFVAPDGKEVKYKVARRGMDRSLGNAVEIAEALKDVITPEEVLGAAKLSLGDLTTIGAQAIKDLAEMMGEKITKKEATQRLISTLESHGLLTQPDGQIEYLRLEQRAKAKKVKSKKTKKQISN